ncbi:PAQR family membrane homeostasis protein TrhA [Clostridium cylindrosporum]|uniref:Channel protein, hemolysin III family n=1 Tax=Clostridium cylindrosporum DSM 605 TaxID=1121307 RepID=A0A0J8DA07_CLOCY|nr:hemolysin III family protein [Clostridium cylindrosporum]KMT21149.1 channel protein, hemolysin III family [Clostridium cylindrosporum DSM 605]
MENLKFYTKGEEIANAITHGIGLLLAIAALVLLIVCGVNYGDVWYMVSSIIYGVTLIVLYMGSTLYHSIPNINVKKILRIVDHSSIFLLIAGTYTPFTLTILRGSLGWTIFGVVWGCTLFGIFMKIFFLEKFEKISTFMYIGMGWFIVIALKDIIMALSTGGLVLLVLGGLSYTVGCIFYAKDKWPYNHAVWHLFVLAGSVFHFLTILLYVR